MSFHRVPLKYYLLCRLCAKVYDEGKVAIFSDRGKQIGLAMKIREDLDMEVEESDRLPKYVCIDCLDKLEALEYFKRQAHSVKELFEGFEPHVNGVKQEDLRLEEEKLDAGRGTMVEGHQMELAASEAHTVKEELTPPLVKVKTEPEEEGRLEEDKLGTASREERHQSTSPATHSNYLPFQQEIPSRSSRDGHIFMVMSKPTPVACRKESLEIGLSSLSVDDAAMERPGTSQVK